jgi:hypothetical protein
MFQKITNQLIASIPGSTNVSDDILIFGKTREEHDKALKKVLTQLQEAGQTLNKEKCEFGKTELKFYGISCYTI